ncbi:MAG: metallophosphoesterase, partial [Paludibacteraceae bacterium]|nr:metallophosphoesterase [Paludibacteraceae bacterium]
MAQKVFFIADTHFHHKNILKHCPERAEVGGYDIDDVDAHDKWVLDMWNSTVGKNDIVYVLGDFAWGSSDHVRRLLSKLHGKKYLVLGNHDKSSDHEDMAYEYREQTVKGDDWPYDLSNYFVQITQMKMVTFKKSVYDFLDEDFMVFMCHYPMVTWPSKHFGCCQLHGHCHARLNDYNDDSTDLRLDVGIDTKYAFWTLEEVYEYFKHKTAGEKFLKYASDMKAEREMIV